MQNLQFNKRVNGEQLDKTLRAAFGEGYIGYTHVDEEDVLSIYLDERITEERRGEVEQLVEAHDPDTRTESQLERAERQAHVEAVNTAIKTFDLRESWGAEEMQTAVKWLVAKALQGG